MLQSAVRNTTNGLRTSLSVDQLPRIGVSLPFTLWLMSQRRAPSSHFCCALRFGWLVVWMILMVATAKAQGSGDVREFQKKAESINNFIKFVDWPVRKFPQPDTPFVIGVYGADNISSLLQESIQERLIKGRPVVIKHLQNKEELRSCHVLFISRSERDRLGPILAEVRRENVLTVGECDNFLDKGGVINFVNVGGQLHFQISTDAAAREKLNVSSHLLQLNLPSIRQINAPR